MKLTRRQLVIAAAGSVAAVNVAAQSASPAPAPADLNQQALSDLRQNADDLSKIDIRMDVAPAFQFKA